MINLKLPTGIWGDKINPKLRDKQFLVWAGAALGLILGFFVIYLPVRAGYQKVLATRTDRTQIIQQAKASGLASLDPGELVRLQGRIARFRGGLVKLPQVASVLDGISENAEANTMLVVGINSEDMVSLEDALQRMPVRVHLLGNASSFANFLAALSQSVFPVFVVDRYVVRKAADKPGLLECDLTISFFITAT